MAGAHKIFVRVFSYQSKSDDKELILEKFKEIFPFKLEEEKISINASEAKGFGESIITIYEISLIKERHIRKFLEHLAKNLDEENKSLVVSQAESRLDEDYNFFLRLDKEEFIKNGKLMITDSGNCFHVKISIAVFPKKRKNALESIKSLFS